VKSKNRFSLLLLVVAAAFPQFDVWPKTPGTENVPAWLQQAMKTGVPAYDKEVPAVLLHNEQAVSIGADGLMTVTTYYAVRVLTREGKNWAVANSLYLRNASRVRDLRAWLFRTNGTTKFYDKESIVDRISDPDDIYDEYRVKSIDASSEADIGVVFGFESVVEEKPLFTQDSFRFQNRLPTLFSRYSISLPSGWQASSVTFNHGEIKPSVNGSRYIWELRDLGPIPREPHGLSVGNLAARLVVNYFAPASNVGVYNSWRDVSSWYSELSASSLTLDDTVAAKARELTANATTDIERIKALAAYVQSLRYISLQIDVARGGGHRPRPANLVLQRGYGDCKDKANLLRTMLKAVKIESYLVLIYSGDPGYVRAEWPSPRQFNHCIIAIAVNDGTNLPTVVADANLGRLLFFDPTDAYTQVGDLPDHEQGSYALISAGAGGDLVRVPTLPPDSNKLEREAEINLSENGAISGKIYQKAYGQSASAERARMRELSASEYRTSLERWLTARVKGGNLTKALPTDRRNESRFDLDLEFSAPVYAQIMQGRLMMFKPAMVGRLDRFIPVEGKRQTPILIDSSDYSETLKVRLPDGFVIDEMPEADKIETAFGKYTSKYEVSGAFLLISRSLVLKRTIIAPSGYDDVGKFFAVVRNAEQSPVVLIRK
jgi:hypothetical protein